jgi:AraC-like DNA-binding protein
MHRTCIPWISIWRLAVFGPYHLVCLFKLFSVSQSWECWILTPAKGQASDATMQVGFGSVRRFNAAFLKLYGRAPSRLRKQNRH